MRTKMLTSRIRNNEDRQRSAKPFCQCWNESRPTPWISTDGCACGEHSDISEWRWEMPDNAGTSWVVMCQDQKQVTFHPYYSSGTAAVKGDTALVKDYHYYWEVKMLTEPYGTDIMVGLGTNKVNMSDSLFTFTSFLGRDAESYGLSYTGALRHDASVCRDNTGFCKGSIIGVKVDLWQGTLEFYLNRKSQGISFYNLRRHQALYPMICSTAAQSSMRLIYAASWQASLLVDAAKILASSVQGDQRLGLPPGLRCTLKNQFWLTLPNQKCILDEDDMQPETTQKPSKSSTTSMDLEPTVDVSPRRLLDQMRVMRDDAHNLEVFNNLHLAVLNNRRSHPGENESDDEPDETRNSLRQTFETYRRFHMN